MTAAATDLGGTGLANARCPEDLCAMLVALMERLGHAEVEH